MSFLSPRRRHRRRFSRWWLLLLLPALLLLTTPMPLPSGIARAMQDAPATRRDMAVVPTARIELRSPTPVAVAAAPAPSEPPTEPPVAPPPPTADIVVPSPASLPPTDEPTATALPPTATLPPPLLIITSPPVPPTVAALPPVAAPPTLLPTLPVAPAPAVAGPAAPLGQPLYIPTLMYHYVRVVDAGSDPLGFNLSVTPQHLEEQLDWIAQRGYTTVTMSTLVRCLNGGTVEQPCPAKPIALTFDDGYEDAFTTALPALQRRGMVATFYIIGNFAGQPLYMSWDQIRALQAAGMEIGAHSMNHPDLTSLGLDQARAEIAESKALIESQIGRPIGSFCYPSGRFNGDTVALVQEAGFTNATTTMSDLPQSNLFLLPRLRIEGGYELGTFQGIVP